MTFSGLHRRREAWRTCACRVVLVAAVAVPAHAASAAALEPVILIHGWLGTPDNMATMKASFQAAGYPAFAIDMPGEDNIVNGRALASYVNDVKAQTGAAKVHLVGHSMGGLSSRYYIKRVDGAATVRTYVSMGTPQYGGWIACVLPPDGGGQMCPTSGFLADLNAGDDTPGTIPYSTFWSDDDNANDTRLDGGACFKEIAGVPHAEEPSSPLFFDAVLKAVQGTCPGTLKTLPIE